MSRNELKTIVSWVVNRKCKRDDSIHIKRAVREFNTTMKITKYEREKLIDMLAIDMFSHAIKNLEKAEFKFAYVATVIYKGSLPHLLENHIQKHMKEKIND